MTGAFKMAAGADTASAFPALQAGAHLSMPSSEKLRVRRVLPSLYVPLDRRMFMLLNFTRILKLRGPPRCCPALDRLRGDCITPNACGPLVLQYGAAPSSAGYQPAALLLSYRRIKIWWPARDLRSARSVKSRLLRYQSLQAVGIRDRAPPAIFALRGRRVW